MTREGIVVLGVPRSGTTLVRRLLDAHSGIACPGETYLLRACARFLEGEHTGAGVDVGVLTGLEHAGFSPAETVGRLRELAFGFHREHARRVGKRRWAEKTAFDVFHLEAIERLCDNRVHYICLVRHGLDVALSVKDLCDRSGAFLLEIHEWVRRYQRPIEAFAHLWRESTERLVQFVERRPADAQLVRYEDLVADPNATLEKLFGFLGEPWEPGLVARALAPTTTPAGLGDWKAYGKSAIDGDSINRWRTLPAATLRLVAPVVNPQLRALGYDEVAVPSPVGGDEARRRYELGLQLQRMRAGKQRTDG